MSKEGKDMFNLSETMIDSAIIKVVGVGGGGSNAVEYMLDQKIEEVDFMCANTDAQALSRSSAATLMQLGEEITKGLGAGANPDSGTKCDPNRSRACACICLLLGLGCLAFTARCLTYR